jgi:hypothetical protein
MGQLVSLPLAVEALLVFITVLVVHKAYIILFPKSKLRSLKGPRDGSFWIGHLKEDRATEPPLMYERWIKTYGPVLRQVGPLNVRSYNVARLCINVHTDPRRLSSSPLISAPLLMLYTDPTSTRSHPHCALVFLT